MTIESADEESVGMVPGQAAQVVSPEDTKSLHSDADDHVSAGRHCSKR